MNRHAILLADRSFFVDGIAEYIHDASERLFAHRYGDRCLRILNGKAPAYALRTAHRDRSNDPITQLLLHL